MLKKMKKKAMKAGMKLMMNEKVARTFMSAVQKKQELNEKLARVYDTVQLPSLADHRNVNYAMDRLRKRVKGLEEELMRAEFALENLESGLEKQAVQKKQTAEKKPVQLNKTEKAKKPAASTPKPEKKAKKATTTPVPAAGLMDAPLQQTASKPAAKKKSAPKPKKAAAPKGKKIATRKVAAPATTKATKPKKAAPASKIAPLGAAGGKRPAASGLLDINLNKKK